MIVRLISKFCFMQNFMSLWPTVCPVKYRRFPVLYSNDATLHDTSTCSKDRVATPPEM